MGSSSAEEDQFFEAREDITSLSDSSSDGAEKLDSDDRGAVGFFPGSFSYEVWTKNLESPRERRNKFLKWMGLNVDSITSNGFGNTTSSEDRKIETDRVTDIVMRF
ncbi:conserved hypothetical protein [Ricinus communis]|uniref:Uncharacterized protein n=1 Tax=Ricinus communis TaxID=3988 RepID=B9SBE1_RICCO|nr:conserved hypothetical protein [Ricinus communis]